MWVAGNNLGPEKLYISDDRCSLKYIAQQEKKCCILYILAFLVTILVLVTSFSFPPAVF
jgi:hypothetical protein